MFVTSRGRKKRTVCCRAADVTCSLNVLSVERECRGETVRLRQLIEGRRCAEAVSGWAAHFGLCTPGKNMSFFTKQYVDSYERVTSTKLATQHPTPNCISLSMVLRLSSIDQSPQEQKKSNSMKHNLTVVSWFSTRHFNNFLVTAGREMPYERHTKPPCSISNLIQQKLSYPSIAAVDTMNNRWTMTLDLDLQRTVQLRKDARNPQILSGTEQKSADLGV